MWYLIIIIGFSSQVMTEGYCILDEVLLLGLIGYFILTKLIKLRGSH